MAIDNTKDTILLKSGGEAKLVDLFGATAATFTKIATTTATIRDVPAGYNVSGGVKFVAITLSDGTTHGVVPFYTQD
jgi:hypothetical protein